MRPTVTECYRCGTCGVIYADRDFAEKCCSCRKCGVETSAGLSRCHSCDAKSDADRIVRYIAEAVETNDPAQLGDMLYCVEKQTYYSDECEALADFDEGCAPDWLFGTTKCRNEFDVDGECDSMTEDTYEDAEICDSPELQALRDAAKVFNEKHAIVYYVPNMKVKTRVPKGES